VASRNPDKSQKGIAQAEARLAGHGGPIHFHLLDLATVAGSRQSAGAFLTKEPRLDILVANAGVSMINADQLSADGFERAFATNHLGHFAFVTELLDRVEETARAHGEARIVVTSSMAFRTAQKLDYQALTTRLPGDGSRVIRDMKGAFQRYCNSKLANIYFVEELDRRLQAKGVTNVYCNVCHPGVVMGTGLGGGALGKAGDYFERAFRAIFGPLTTTMKDGAKTQTYLAASPVIVDKNIHGEYWAPKMNWLMQFVTTQQDELTDLAKDPEEQKKLWEVSEKAMKVTG